ncbi:MAG: YebC/PmpR family DNA-binding transcriptional regulator, partial [Candidatus Poribacteria bacterium]|nr:YebC/PmpR family DNA-binding transcriptional regulator [Candidatus Poribacteria bacterium]
AGFEDIFEAALESGATDVNSSETNHEVICVPDELHFIQSKLETAFGPPVQSELQWKPLTTIKLDIGIWERLYKLLELLEDNDDVRSVSANYEMGDSLLKAVEN